MKSQHAARLSMFITLVIGACAMLHIYLHRNDETAPSQRTVASQEADSAAIATSSRPENVKFASYTVNDDSRTERIVIVLDGTHVAGDAVVVELLPTEDGEICHKQTFRIVE